MAGIVVQDVSRQHNRMHVHGGFKAQIPCERTLFNSEWGILHDTAIFLNVSTTPKVLPEHLCHIS